MELCYQLHLFVRLVGCLHPLKNILIQDNIAENGYYHIVVNSVSKEQLSKYENNKDVKKVNALYELGVSSYKKIEKEEIIEKDNGRVIVNSSEGEGTTFSIKYFK